MSVVRPAQLSASLTALTFLIRHAKSNGIIYNRHDLGATRVERRIPEFQVDVHIHIFKICSFCVIFNNSVSFISDNNLLLQRQCHYKYHYEESEVTIISLNTHNIEKMF